MAATELQSSGRSSDCAPSPPAMRVSLLGLVLVCAFALSGCSTKITYNFLDWWMGWLVRDYVTLERGQRREVRAAIDSFHDWHRNTQLPLYADTLAQLQADLRRPDFSGDELEKYGEAMAGFWETALQQLSPAVVSLAASLSQRQVRQVHDNLEKQRLEFAEDYVEPGVEELQKQRAERVQDTLQSAVGRLNDEQKQMIRLWSEQIRPIAAFSIDLRVLWQEEFLQVMADRGETQDFAQRIDALMFYTDRWPDEYRQAVDHNEALTYRLMADLNRSLTQKQQLRRDKTLQRYIDDFRALAEG